MEKAAEKCLKRKCEMCVEVEAKYKCPRCQLQTCSLPCVKRHKIEKECDGKRCVTEFVSIKNFNESNLLSDYRFLESASHCASNAARNNKVRTKFQKNKHLTALLKQARSRGINLHLVSMGMSKRKENTSIYHYKEKCIYWRVKLVFANEEAEYVISRVNEKESLQEILKRYIHPEESDSIIRFRLKSYVNAWFDKIKIYMKKEKTRNQGYHEIDGLQTLEECLKHKTIFEYPTFYISIAGKDCKFKEIDSSGN